MGRVERVRGGVRAAAAVDSRLTAWNDGGWGRASGTRRLTVRTDDAAVIEGRRTIGLRPTSELNQIDKSTHRRGRGALRNQLAWRKVIVMSLGHRFSSTCETDGTRRLLNNSRWGNAMENAGIGWIAAIIIGGIAGWLAEMFMKSNMGVLMNVLLGIVGAIIANFILSLFGVTLGGWLGYLIAGFIGACILIAVARMIRRPA